MFCIHCSESIMKATRSGSFCAGVPISDSLRSTLPFMTVEKALQNFYSCIRENLAPLHAGTEFEQEKTHISVATERSVTVVLLSSAVQCISGVNITHKRI